jgi:hypothetical protein
MDTVKNEYLTSDEVLRRFPCLITRFNWNITTPGQLHAIGLLHGKYLKGKRMLLISIVSMKRLIKYYKDDLEDTQHDLE